MDALKTVHKWVLKLRFSKDGFSSRYAGASHAGPRGQLVRFTPSKSKGMSLPSDEVEELEGFGTRDLLYDLLLLSVWIKLL